MPLPIIFAQVVSGVSSLGSSAYVPMILAETAKAAPALAWGGKLWAAWASVKSAVIIGAGVVGVAGIGGTVVTIVTLRNQLHEARTEQERTVAQARIDAYLEGLNARPVSGFSEGPDSAPSPVDAHDRVVIFGYLMRRNFMRDDSQVRLESDFNIARMLERLTQMTDQQADEELEAIVAAARVNALRDDNNFSRRITERHFDEAMETMMTQRARLHMYSSSNGAGPSNS